MYYSSVLEYIVGNSYAHSSYSNLYPSISYFSKTIEDNYVFERANLTKSKIPYPIGLSFIQYGENQQNYSVAYLNHSFSPEIFLNPSRPKTRFVEDISGINIIAEETFEFMMKKTQENQRFFGHRKSKGFSCELPKNISINILPFEEFKVLHSSFGEFSNGVLGFSVNGDEKKIFVRENNLDILMIVIGHEIGHVLTETLPNKHDEEAKAFAFSIEWAKTIKKHNIADLGASIKDEINFQPARNGLHDAAFAFVKFMMLKGKEAIELHNDLARKYITIFATYF